MEIRIVRSVDAYQIAELYAPLVTEGAVSFEEVAPDAAEIMWRIEEKTAQYPWLVADHAGQVAGYTYATGWRTRAAYDWSCETTIVVDPAFHRRGVGRALLTGICAVLAAQGYTRACAVVTIPNEASSGLHAAVGFELAGVFDASGYKQGRWHDLEFWWRRLRDLPTEPTSPIPFAAFRETEEVARLLAEASELIKT
jgi:phosphinothricin acetyltransferase